MQRAFPLECFKFFVCYLSRWAVAGLGHRGNTTTAVIDLYDTNTITMVARESGNIFIALKKLNVRSFKILESKMAFNLPYLAHQGDESSVSHMSVGELC